MTDESSSSTTTATADNTTTATTTTATTTTATTSSIPNKTAPPSETTTPTTTWALPDGIEDDIEQALIKTTIGALAGGVVGLICFKGGKGSRAASIATGIGAGLGSTWERARFRYENQQNNK